jgi:acyl carrier protein
MLDKTFDRIQSIVASHLGIEPGKVSLTASFMDDLGADSLDLIELIIALEDVFDVAIPNDALDSIVTMQDLVGFIDLHTRGRT